MSEQTAVQAAEPGEGERSTLLVAYICYCLTLVTGFAAVVGVIINHIKVGESANEFLRSHHRWLLRTFWFSLLWSVVCAVLMLTVILIPLAWIGLSAVTIWYIYRVVRGLINFTERRPMPV
ncbi:MAG: hypothetical protein JOY51_04770 [Nevskia sp.]|nr:hypothetical protein [Nevskia sp.]